MNLKYQFNILQILPVREKDIEEVTLRLVQISKDQSQLNNKILNKDICQTRTLLSYNYHTPRRFQLD